MGWRDKLVGIIRALGFPLRWSAGAPDIPGQAAR